MNALQLVNTVLTNLDSEEVSTLSGASGIASRALSWVNTAIAHIYNQSTQWSFREAQGSLDVTPGQGSYTFPSDVDMDSIKYVIYTGTAMPLQYMDYESWFRRGVMFPLSATNGIQQPACYTFIGQNILLWPTATKYVHLRVWVPEKILKRFRQMMIQR